MKQHLCNACGDRHNHDERSSFCRDCYHEYLKTDGNMVAGTWRVRDDEIRELFASLIEYHTPYKTWTAERVGDIYVYEPDKIDLEVGGGIEVP